MKLLNKMKIGTKLAILMFIMITGTIIIGSIGLYYNTKSNKALKDIYTQNIIAIEKLSDARTQSRANFANILNLIVTEDENGRKKITDNFEERVIKIENDFKEYEKLTFTEYETEQYNLIKENTTKWDTITKQMIDLETTGKTKEATTLFKITGEGVFEELQTSIRDLVNYNIQEAEDIYNEDEKNGIKATTQIITYALIISILSIALGVLITLTITKPIMRIVSLIKKTSNLDLIYDSSYASLLTQKDETGIIAVAVEDLRVALRNIAGNIISVSNNLAASSEELAATTEESAKTVNQVVNAINEIAQGNSIQAEMVTNTNETITTMVASIEEVNNATANNSKNAKKSMEIINEGQKAINFTMDKMRENIKVSGDVGDSINELSKQMDKVGSIIKVISEISSQTNLLALNASIEAARVGEAGKGFAVVANEIGKLAKNTATAVNEITVIITDAVSRNLATAENNDRAKSLVSEQEKAINITKEAFNHIKLSVEDISQRTMNISERINEITASSKGIANQTQDMSAVAQESAAGSEEIAASNEEQLASIEMIAAASNDLSSMATELNIEINRFKI